MTESKRWIPVATATAFGAVVGWMVDRTLVWTTIGAVVGLGIAVMIVWYHVRPLVAVTVGVGAGLGAFLGGRIVAVLCEPSGCPAFEATAATTTGIGALVGIGLVVALATRSFDEYREAQERGAPPPTSSCAVDDKPAE